MVLAAGSRLVELLTGEYIRNAPYASMIRCEPAENPRYVAECHVAVLFRYESLAPASIDAKARDVVRKLAEAVDQLPVDRPGIVHIGFEAVEGDRVEEARYRKIVASTEKFDPRGKPLKYVYCHYFVPECPPDQAWSFDETTHRIARDARHPEPLGDVFLVLAPGSEERKGPHWRS